MRTRQISLILIFTLFVSMAMAQSGVPGKTSFAVLGGVNFQNLNGEDNSGKQLENDLLIGYHAGVNVQFPVAPQFYFQPGLQFSTKGAESVSLLTPTYKLSYIEMPLNFVYKAQLGNGFIFVGLGPYVAYGVAGKAIYEGGSVTSESDIVFKNEVVLGDPLLTVYVKPFDAGGNILFGYEMAGGLFLQMNAQLGMLDIKPDHYLNPDDSSTLKNTGYGLSLGYRF
ncbi:MAG TPA: porin family protein [Draconibacterium sp.]|nr:porin family protein [Draconibacterium sp.]